MNTFPALPALISFVTLVNPAAAQNRPGVPDIPANSGGTGTKFSAEFTAAVKQKHSDFYLNGLRFKNPQDRGENVISISKVDIERHSDLLEAEGLKRLDATKTMERIETLNPDGPLGKPNLTDNQWNCKEALKNKLSMLQQFPEMRTVIDNLKARMALEENAKLTKPKRGLPPKGKTAFEMTPSDYDIFSFARESVDPEYAASLEKIRQGTAGRAKAK